MSSYSLKYYDFLQHEALTLGSKLRGLSALMRGYRPHNDPDDELNWGFAEILDSLADDAHEIYNMLDQTIRPSDDNRMVQVEKCGGLAKLGGQLEKERILRVAAIAANCEAPKVASIH